MCICICTCICISNESLETSTDRYWYVVLTTSKRLNSIFPTRCEHPLASKSKGWVKKVPIHWQMVIVKVIEWSSGWNFRSKFFCGISIFLSLNSPWNLLECQMWRRSSISICINTNVYFCLFLYLCALTDHEIFWNVKRGVHPAIVVQHLLVYRVVRLKLIKIIKRCKNGLKRNDYLTEI